MFKKLLINYWPILLLLTLSGLIIWPIFQAGYFSHHDDLQVMRIYEMRRCFEDLQIPCRWVPDMGFGNGFPLFNYYGVLPYYIGATLSYFLGYIGAAKALFLIPLVGGGLLMYILGKELFGKVAGLATAVLFMFAPYRALDSYVRGAIAESFGIALAPLMFAFSLRLIRKKSPSNFIGFALSTGLFLLCHNIMTLYFLPVLILWLIFWMVMERSKSYLTVFGALVLGISLASFFLVPAFVEKSLVQTETLTRFGLDFRAHYVGIGQLFLDNSWGYGASEYGPHDTISFQIGWPHWMLATLSVILAILVLVFKNNSKRLSLFNLNNQSSFLKNTYLLGFLSIIFLLTVFLMHNRSIFIWDNLSLLQFSQFPWRLLSLTIFTVSLMGGFLVFIFKGRFNYVIAGVIILITIILNWNFFKPQHFYPNLTDQEKTSGILWRIQQQAGILDYLPKTAEEPKDVAPKTPEVISGEAEVTSLNNRSNKWDFNAKVFKKANIEVPVFDFPNWDVFVNSKEFEHSHRNRLGRIRIDLPPGEYKVAGELTNTPIRTFADALTIIAGVILIGIVIYGKKVKFFK